MDRTWFNGIYRYDGHSFHHYLLGIESPGNAVSAILPDRRGGLWVGTYTGIFYFPTGEIDPKRQSHLLESKLITCVIEDRDGSILVGTSTGLFRIRDGVVLPIDGMPHPYLLSLTLDSIGYVWTGTKAGGLTWVHQEQATPLRASSGITPLLVNTAIEDRDRHLWLGTSRGIVRLSLTELHDVANDRQSQLSTVIFGKGEACGRAQSFSSARRPPTCSTIPAQRTRTLRTAAAIHRSTPHRRRARRLVRAALEPSSMYSGFPAS